MDFMGLLFFVLSIGFAGINIWDIWEEHKSRNLFSGGGFLPRYFFRPLIAAEPEAIEPVPDAKFSIQSARAARRCEVCHHTDRFEADTGFCNRCDHHTL
jgi:hypothetical protein